jgi:ERCC4-type nuclease
MSEVSQVCQVHVDYRETALINLLNASSLGLSGAVQSKQLYLGDIQILGNINGHNVHLLFERKTTQDLAASIVDGRYREQKARILSAFPPHLCTYIIEGSRFGEHTNLRISQATYDGAIVHTMYRDKMHVVFTNDVKDTANFICSIVDKCNAHPEYFSLSVSCEGGAGGEGEEVAVGGGVGGHEYVSLLKHKTKKKDNIDKLTCYILQLCQIPGLSHKIAQEIANKYPSYVEFITALKDCPDDGTRIKLLKQINMIAEKKAKTIVEFVM